MSALSVFSVVKQSANSPGSRNQAFRAIAMALLGIAPLIQLNSWTQHDLQRSIQVTCILLIGVGWASSMLRRRIAPPGCVPLRFLVIWLLLACSSAYDAKDSQVAFQELGLLVGCLILVDAVCQRQILAADEWIGRGVAIGAAAYAAVSLFVFAGALASASTLYLNALTLGFENYRFLNHTQTVFLPFVAVVAVSDSGLKWRRTAWLALILHLALLALTRGRATAIGLITATLIALFWIRSEGVQSLARALGWSAVVGLAVYAGLYLDLPQFLGVSWGESAGSVTDVASGSERLILWQAALAAIQQSPWLGIGPMHFAGLHLPMGAHPHNVYLQWTAEYGLPAGLMMSAALVWLLYRSARRLRSDPSRPVLATGAWIACMAAATDGLLSGNFVMPLSQCWIAVAFGIMLRLTALPDLPHLPDSQAARPRRIVAVAVALAFIVSLSVRTVVDAAKTPPHVGQVLWASDPGMPTNPRFWLNGRL